MAEPPKKDSLTSGRNRELLARIGLDRIVEDLWRLVCIASPTCKERKVALAFAEMLSTAGAEVEVDEMIPESPVVIGRLKGNRPGRTIQMAGHIDHIDVPHPKPRRDDKIISGRGSADMKNGLAGILEVVRVLAEGGCDFPGEVLVTVYGRHEAPAGDSACLLNLIKQGVLGDAALVVEEGHATAGKAVIMGKGQSIWNITIRWAGQSCHELNRPPDADNLLVAFFTVAESLRDYGRRVNRERNAYKQLDAESLFIGQGHYGDFYNRVPTECRLQGTRRWHPHRNFEEIKQEFDEVLASIGLPTQISLDCTWTFCGESYEVNPDEAIVQALRRARESVTGEAVEYGGTSMVLDANKLVPFANVPTVLCGFDTEFAHADFEYVRLNRLLEPTRVALLTTLNYLWSTESEEGD